MKRKPLNPGQPLKRKTHIKRRSERGVYRRSGIKPQSAKRKAEMVERRAMVAEIAANRPVCEGYELILAGLSELGSEPPPLDAQMVMMVGGRLNGKESRRKLLLALRACQRSQPCEAHEPLKRSRGGSITDPDNVLWLCSPCHRWTEEEVTLATQLGLLTPSWARW